MTANIAIKSELSAILPIIFSIFCRETLQKPLSSFSFCRQKENRSKRKSAKTSWAQRPEHKFFKSLNELASLKQHLVFRSSDCSHNQRLNIDSKNLHSSKDLFVRNVFEELRNEKAWSTSAVTNPARLLPTGRKNVFEKLRDADNLLLIWRIYPIKARILEKKKIIPKTFRTFRAPW